MYIRLSSSCGQSDFEFYLSGSTSAINFVASDYIAKGKQIELARIKEKEEEKKIMEMLSSEEHFKAKAKYSETIYYGPMSSTYYNKIKYGEEIVFSNYSEDKEYCILHKASTIELPIDTIFYISRDCIDLKTVERINE